VDPSAGLSHTTPFTLMNMTRFLFVTATLVLLPTAVASAQAPDTTPPRTRAESLYVSSKWEDHPPRDFARDIAEKARTDSIYRARSKGVMDFQKIT
jgi:hypothetical protein